MPDPGEPESALGPPPMADPELNRIWLDALMQVVREQFAGEFHRMRRRIEELERRDAEREAALVRLRASFVGRRYVRRRRVGPTWR